MVPHWQLLTAMFVGAALGFVQWFVVMRVLGLVTPVHKWVAIGLLFVFWIFGIIQVAWLFERFSHHSSASNKRPPGSMEDDG
jgi:hypothetical protein